MSRSLDASENKAGLPGAGKCSSKDGSQGTAAGAEGCACKRRGTPSPTAEGLPPSVASEVESAAMPPAMETANAEEPPPQKAACGCGHHTAESTAPEQAEATAAEGTCGCQKLLWIRRTHSACGLVFGAFLVEHLAATALGLRPGLFEQYMRKVHAALVQAPWLEALVFLPLAALVPFGVYLLTKAGLRYDVKKCKRGGKMQYFLQRASAVAILAFLAFHLLTLRAWEPRSAGTDAWKETDPTAADSTRAAFAAGVQQIWGFLPRADAPSSRHLAVAVFYLSGTAAAIYHFSNGLWSGAIAWGWTQSAASQQRSLWAFTAWGILLGVLGALGWYAFVVVPFFLKR
jgi:succinate dehydrogenase / fumarate reductase cytochrome b subunit